MFSESSQNLLSELFLKEGINQLCEEEADTWETAKLKKSSKID